ncbi:non-ribosomal peptide synthetase [Pseudomonas putida]|uniref:non-ribosomal peptide synthetase n=1 Tax=Pseudomonas putida TaxID=303 RepID=UPI002DBCD3DB|nr:non-ribosomal peptide synthetase [Pseudomonas putida]WRW01730.1 amino acid adenylation domain-containing protein [Pseudomonas putida]
MNDKVKALSRNIEAIYPLAPMQQGLLFHSLMHPGKGMYLLQYRHVMTLPDFDLPAFRQAWEQVVQRHELLRTSFVWKQQKRPMQVVHKQVELPIDYQDWTHLDSATQQAQLDTLLADERRDGLDFTKAPLMRVRLLRIGPDTYQFVRSYHHILMDAWCFSIIMLDFLNGYRAAREGRRLELPAPRPYKDFIRWLEQQKPEDHQAFWQQRLAGFDTPNEFGFGHAGRIAEADEPVRDCVVHLDEALTSRLQQSASRHGITLNTLVQGAWALLLGRYSGDRDLLFGVTVAGRPVHMAGMESVVGLFINSLPLRWQWRPEQALGQWLTALQSENLSLREHETVPLATLQRWSDVQGQDLFQSLFVFENAPISDDVRQGAMDYLISDMANRTHTNYPITVVIVPGPRLHLQLTYQCDWFQHGEIQAMLGHFRTLLVNMGAALAERPGTALQDIVMLGKAEIERQFNQWASGGLHAVDALAEGTYIERFERQVRRTPERIAVVHDGQSVSYDALNRAANRLARRLRAAGVENDRLVALLDERGIDLLVMILATLKAGAGWLPLDPRNPPQRLAQVLDQSRTPLLVYSPALTGLAREALTVMAEAPQALAYEADALGEYADDDLQLAVDPRSLAYCIFTSGSTGTPKGAMVTHAGMLNNILGKLAAHDQGQSAGLGLDEHDVIAQAAPQCFDISVWQSLAGSMLGARTVIFPDCLVQNPQALADALVEQGVTLFEAVPSLMHALLDCGLQRSALRWVLATGEALPPALLRRWFEHYPAIPLMNAYGPAECSDDVAFHALTEALPPSRSSVPIGRATLNNRLYLLGPDLEPLPTGAVGEVCVAGVGVGRGYMADPGRTAAVFVPDPMAGDGSRLYRTGDLARFLPDGELEYVGRTDHQVKVRGHRIELDEIEACLTRHPRVREAVVLARDDRQRAKVLVGYVVAQAHTTLEVLREHVAQQLPAYMVPGAFVLLEKMPLNANGKIDRKQLPAPDFAAQSASRYVAPRDVLEQQMVEAWQELLDLPRVGVEDHFFELGGHSLLATQLIGLVGKLSGKDLPLRIVFERPTITGMADWLRTEDAAAQPRGPQRLPRPERLPLSFAQQRMWFLQQLEPASPAYNLAGAVRLLGTLSVETLQAALHDLLREHEVLRTLFSADGGEPAQVILSDVASPLQLHDVADEEELLARLHDDAMTPFVLNQGPLLRARLYRLSEAEQVLSLTCHHIIADGWSLQLFIDGLCRRYRALLERQERPAPASDALQYADFAVWQRQWMEGEDCQQQLAFWREQLAGELPVLELAADYPRPAQPTQAGGRVDLVIPEGLATQLRAFASAQGWSPFIPLLSAYQLLLRALSGEQDILVGVPVANRHHAALQNLMGCLVNTLVYRQPLSGAHSLQQLMTDLQARSTRIQAHQDLPFDYLIEQLGVTRQVSYNPIFQAMFNYFPGHALERIELPGLIGQPLDNRPRTALCDLHLDVRDSVHGISLSFAYSRDLFRQHTVERMAGHYLALLEALLNQPNLALGELSGGVAGLAAPALVGQTVTGSEDLLGAFDAHVQRQPEATALVAGEQTLNYAELARAVERLAGALQSRGVKREDRVALCLPRGLNLPVALLAILRCGAVYVPLAEDAPAERGAYVLEQAQPQWCLVDAQSAGLISQWGSDVPLLDIDTIAGDMPFTAPEVLPGQLAYLLYTSGSTGRPKGVAIDRGNLANLMLAVDAVLPLTPADRVLALTTATFDIAVLELLLPLARGASVLLADREQARDPQAIDRLLEHGQPTVMQATPATWRMLVAHTRRDWHGVRAVSGGEALPVALAQAMQRRGAQVINGYGPTEATVYSTFEPCQGSQINAEVPIGKPVVNSAAYILDADLQPVPDGVAGELYLAGASLARGYYAAPDLTAKAFLPDPFGSGGRMYRTGDRVRRNAQGSLEYLGRLDFQVKLRGFRIELGEIEAVLAAVPGIREAAVVLFGEGEQARLVAYYAGEARDEAWLREQLLGRLPDYMLPAQFVHMERLPLGASAKVDRKALPEPVARVGQGGTQLNLWESRLAALWEELLGSRNVGPHDHFFELGGHSLLAARLVARIAERHQRQIPLRSVFEAPTLSALAQRLSDGQDEPEAVLRAFCGDTAPLHFTQQRLWFIEHLQGDAQAWHLSLALQLDGELQAGLLEEALRQLTARQHSLRTRFEDGEDGPQQRVVELHGPLLDVLAVDGEVTSALREHALAAFDTADRLWRACLYQGPGRNVLQITLHHLIADARSLEVLFSEWQGLYRALVEGTSAQLPALPLQFRDVAASWQSPQGIARIESQLDWWRQRLAGEPPVLNLPTDLPRPARQGYRGQRLRFNLATDQVARLQTEARRQGLTAFAPLLAAWNLLLARHSGQREIWIGLPVAQRHQAHTEHLIGYFASTQVLRSALEPLQSVQSYWRQLQDQHLEAQQHADVPFERLVDAVQVRRELSHTPLFQALFNLIQRDVTEQLASFAGLPAQRLDIDTHTALTDIGLHIEQHGEQWQCVIEYNTDLFVAPTAQRYADEFRYLLDGMLATPEAALWDIDLANADHQLGQRPWHQAAERLASEQDVIARFEHQTRRTPDALAVDSQSSQLTYAGLNARANRIARALRQQGVGRDDLVAVCLSRGEWLLPTLLGVLKAGAAYLPLDSQHPAERLRYIVGHARAQWLLGDSACAQTLDAVATEGVVSLRVEQLPLAAQTDADLGLAVHGQQRAYVIYTSGSTGLPKGVQVGRENLGNLLAGLDSVLPLTAADTWLASTTYAFHMCKPELYLPLVNGASMLLAQREQVVDGHRLFELLRRATVFQATPAGWQLLLETARTDWPALRGLIGGEAVPAELVHALQGKGVRLINAYGPTETTVWSTTQVLDKVSAGVADIGSPLLNTRCYVLDELLRPVPLGTVGELYIGGTGVTRGYHQAPALTAAAYLPDPYASEPGLRMYRTGDLVRRLADGRLAYVGRADFQVKVRGFRIEPGEIESLLRRYPGVEEAVVMQDAAGSGLVAWLQVPSEQGFDNAALRRHLEAALPAYMVPGQFIVLPRFALNANGKIDRKALPQPSPQTLGHMGIAPGNELEHELASIWQELLDLPSVGVTDSFFELGGHSLLAMRLMTRIETRFGVRLDLRGLFMDPTIRGLAAQIERPQGPSADQTLDEMQRLLSEMED